jgi:hypothetical protein
MIRFDLTAPLHGVSSAFDSLQSYVYGIAFLLTLIGYYSQVWRHRSEPPKTLEGLGTIALTVLFAASIPFWRPYLVNLFYFPAEQLARANSVFRVNVAVNNFYRGVSALVTEPAPEAGSGTVSQAIHFIWNLGEITRAAMLNLTIGFLVYVLSLLAAFIVLPFYFLQQVLVTALFTFMPAAICALTVPTLRDRAVAYLGMTASVLAWPLGFSIVAAATNVVFDVPFNSGGPIADSVALVLGPILQVLVAAIIMLIGTFLVPPTMFFLALHGGAHIDPIMSAARSVPMLGSLAKR